MEASMNKTVRFMEFGHTPIAGHARRVVSDTAQPGGAPNGLRDSETAS
jgi:hypothetical protein